MDKKRSIPSPTMPLTVSAVKQAKPQQKPYRLSDAGGLDLHVLPTGAKVWRANYRVGGRGSLQRTHTDGRWPTVRLAQARIAHEMAKGVHSSKSDSLDVVQAKPVLPTFEQVAKRWLEIQLPALANPKHRRQVENTLKRFVFPVIDAQPIDPIDRGKLIDTVRAVQDRHDKGGEGGAGCVARVETAHRVAGRITAIFDHVQDLGLIQRHPAAALVRVLQPARSEHRWPASHLLSAPRVGLPTHPPWGSRKLGAALRFIERPAHCCVPSTTTTRPSPALACTSWR